MKLSDYVVGFLADRGIKHVFTVTGGACAHLIDSFHGRKDISYVCVQHEQAGAMAAEAYSRVGPGLGTAIVTSGPGATNLITGICCAWFDSTPCVFLSGQVNTFESKGELGVRQVGFQETDIVSVVKPITKLAEAVSDPDQIRRHLEKAFHVAQSGRPGPVLLDIPMNIQRAQVDPATLPGYVPEPPPTNGAAPWRSRIAEAARLVRDAERPIILAGGGIRLAGGVDEFMRFVERAGAPVVSSWSAIDLLPHDHPLYVGQIGVYGNRGANFAIQNADLLVSVGSRLDTRQTGGRPDTFARAAKKIVVDVDAEELKKRVRADLPFCADAREFLAAMNEQLGGAARTERAGWLERVAAWKRRYPAVLPEWREQKGSVNSYVFIEALSEALRPGDTIVTDCGGNLTWTIQAFHVKAGQRLFSAMGNSPMGYSLPAAIGACFGRERKRIICIIGDGGLQMNIQELQTLRHYGLPVKVFILNNRCYGIIKQFQEMYFDARYEATVPETGYSSPDFVKVAEAYGLAASSIDGHGELAAKIAAALATDGPAICDVRIAGDQKLVPKLEFTRPIEDQTPYLDRREFAENMIIEPLEESKARVVAI